MTTRTARGAAALVAGGLAAAALTVVGPGAPAGADEGCLTEESNPPMIGSACDDSVQPTTSATMTPTPTEPGGYLADSRPVFTFTGDHPDADVDPIGFQCQIYQGTTAPSGWQTCTSPWQPPESAKLADSNGNPWTFRVRAADTADAARDVSSILGSLPPRPQDVPDLDETPESFTFLVDTQAPQESTIKGQPVDPLSPRWPMLRQPRLDLTLEVTQDAGSPVGASCELDEEPVACEPGPFTLTDLRPGDHIFKLAATDAAGNQEKYAARVMFTVPRNLTSAKRVWKTVAAPGAFAGDLLQTRKVGAAVRVPAKNVREVRLIAPSDPRQGRVEVYAGKQLLRTISLRGADENPQRVFTVRPAGSVRISRPITVRVVRVPKGGSVRLDALLVR